MTALKWAYRYGVLEVEEYDTLDEAVSAAIGASDAGSESLQAIEIVENRRTVRVLSADEVWKIEQERAPAYVPSEPADYVVEIADPEGKWAQADRFVRREEAVQEAERLRGVVGPSRIRARRDMPFSKQEIVVHPG